MWGEKRNVWKFAAIYLKDEVLHTRVQFVLEISRQMPLFDEFGSNSLRHTLDGRELGLQVATPLHSISEISEVWLISAVRGLPNIWRRDT